MSVTVGSPSAPIGTPPKPKFTLGINPLIRVRGGVPTSMLKHNQWYLKVGDVLGFSFMVLGLRYRSHKLPNHMGSDALVTLGRLCDLFLGVTGQPHAKIRRSRGGGF